MTLREAIGKLVLLSEDVALEVARGTSNFKRFVGYLDNGQQKWAAEPGVNWRSLRRQKEIPLTVDNVYVLEEAVDVSDSVYDNVEIHYTEAGEEKISVYEVISPDYFRRLKGGQVCTFEGNKLMFPSPFRSDDPRIGGIINYPYYIQPTTINQQTPDDYEIECDIPDFVVYFAASEAVAGGYIKEERRPEFLDQAADYMDEMKIRNDATTRRLEGGEDTPGLSILW